jgi:uncharacterized phage protein (TIGR02216 family)
MHKNNWLPWPELMAFGLGHLRLSSKEFWGMSLRELDAAIEGRLGKSTTYTSVTRNQLAELMRKHPDQ